MFFYETRVKFRKNYTEIKNLFIKILEKYKLIYVLFHSLARDLLLSL